MSHLKQKINLDLVLFDGVKKVSVFGVRIRISVQIQENVDQNNSEYGYFPGSGNKLIFSSIALIIISLAELELIILKILSMSGL